MATVIIPFCSLNGALITFQCSAKLIRLYTNTCTVLTKLRVMPINASFGRTHEGDKRTMKQVDVE